MAKQVYAIDGMTCQGCVTKVQNKLNEDSRIEHAEVSLEPSQVTLQTKEQSFGLEQLKALVASAGPYTVTNTPPSPPITPSTEDTRSFFDTYKPLLLIVGLLVFICTLAQVQTAEPMIGLLSVDPMLWMRHFMAGFFLAFSFFKLLNVSGFANSYRMYDWVAQKFPVWGYIYPFVELSLGALYLTNAAPVFTNWATVIILGVSSLGVIESNLNKKKIQCACLGDVFDLPMSVVTIVEDITMVAMAAIMLIL